MPKRCFVTHCESGYDSEIKFCRENNLKPKSLFQAPKVGEIIHDFYFHSYHLSICNYCVYYSQDPKQLRLWQLAIPRLDKVLSPSNYVCEKHFSDRFIERSYRTKLPNGTEHVIPRERPLLLPNAVPSKFPGCPKYLSKKSPVKRKLPSQRARFTPTVAVRPRRIIDATGSSSSGSEDNSNSTEHPSMETASTNASQVTNSSGNFEPESATTTFGFADLQNSEFNRNSWSRTTIFQEKSYVRYLHWPSQQYLSCKYVDIDETMSVRVRTYNYTFFTFLHFEL